jgi:hypothetical protein
LHTPGTAQRGYPSVCKCERYGTPPPTAI